MKPTIILLNSKAYKEYDKINKLQKIESDFDIEIKSIKEKI